MIRRGIISHFGVLDDINFMWIDTIAVGGFSGSPLVKFDKQKKAVSLVSSPTVMLIYLRFMTKMAMNWIYIQFIKLALEKPFISYMSLTSLNKIT